MKLRSEKAIRKAEQEFFGMVWYERKLIMFMNIQDGVEQMPSKETYDKIIKEMKRINEQLGYKGVKDDFEWGMINGKLSALRWVMGHDWDFLDT